MHKRNHHHDRGNRRLRLGRFARPGRAIRARFPKRIRLWLLIVAVIYAITSSALGQSGEPPADPGGECGWNFLCHLQAFAEWVVCWLIDTIWVVTGPLLETIPEDFSENLSGISYYIGVAETWFPVSYTAGLIAAMLAFLVAMAIVRVICYFVPTIG